MDAKEKIPERIKRLFWDTRRDEVDKDLHRTYIIGRIMDHGDMGDVKWMLATYSREEIVEVVRNRRGLSRKSAFFWSAYFNIAREEVECLKTPYGKKPGLF